MARRAKRRTGGPSYDEVKAKIDAKEEAKKSKKSTLTTATKSREKTTSSTTEESKQEEQRNRISHIRDNLIGTEHPDDLMTKIIESLSASGRVPQEGKYYVFIYNAKTPNLRYDQHPMVAVTNLFEWGFRGINFHWNTHRNYTWNEVMGGLYEITQDELQDLDGVPFARFRMNV